jgi:3-oxoacyl-[acyl-carrier protein] reductase
MDLDLNGRVAVVTGASMGIGREIAKVLSHEGTLTVVIARRRELLMNLAEEIQQSGAKRPLVIVADLHDRTSPQRVRDEVIRTFGHVDILVNNAGGTRPAQLCAADDVWDESFALNFTNTRKMTQAFLPLMQDRKWGRIVNITGTTEPLEMNAAHPAKAAVHAWAKSVAREVAKDAITVNCLTPGRIHSEQIDKRVLPTPEIQGEFVKANIPAGYIGEPSDMAYMTAFLCSQKARYITGQRFCIDGGLHRAVV